MVCVKPGRRMSHRVCSGAVSLALCAKLRLFSTGARAPVGAVCGRHVRAHICTDVCARTRRPGLWEPRGGLEAPE